MGTHRGGLAHRWHRAIGSGLLVIVGLLVACGVDDQGEGAALPRAAAVQELESGLREAFRLANQGHITEARASLAMYMRQAGPAVNDYQAETLMAYCYQRSDRYEQARQHLERVVATQPDYHLAWYLYGYCLYSLGELEEARGAFERHLADKPNSGDAHYGLGLVAFDEDRLADAEACFRMAAESLRSQRGSKRRTPSQQISKCLARLGDVHLRRSQLGPARSAYEEAVELWPTHEDAWYRLSRVLTRMDEPDAASEALARHDLIVAQLPERQQREGMR